MADGEVKIKISAENKTDAPVESAEKKFKGMGEQVKRMGGEMREGLSGAIEQMTGLNLASLTLAGAITGAAAAAQKAVADYSAYVDSIDKLSMSTGMGADQVSRLVQVADDFRVEQSGLENAMKLALQNGFVPTIENMATLADRYKSIQDPAQRAAELQKIFGRSWQELVPLLEQGGDAIRKASDEMSGSLVVTKEAVVQNRLYMKTVDDFNDSWTAVRYTFANIVTGPLADLIKGINLLGDETKDSKDAWDFAPVIGPFVSLGKRVKEAYDERQASTKKMLSEMDKEEGAAKTLTTATEETTKAIDKQSNSMGFYAERAQAVKRHAIEMSNELQQQSSILDQLKAAQDQLQQAQANWASGAGSDAAAALKEGWISAEQYRKGLDVVDEVMGTSLGTQQDYNTELSKAAAEFRRTGDMEAYKAKLIEIKDQYRPLEESVRKASDQVKIFQDMWNSLQNKSLLLRVETDQAVNAVYAAGGTTHSAGTGTSGRQSGESDGASGLDFIVPAGYPDDSYRVNVQSGERVTVTPAGEKENKPAQNVTYNIFTKDNPGRIKNALTLSRLMGGAA